MYAAEFACASLLRKPSSCCFSDKSVGISAKKMRTAHIIILRLVMYHHVVVCVCVCVVTSCLGRCVSSGQERKSRKIPKTGINKGAHKLTQRVEKDSLVTCHYIDSARQTHSSPPKFSPTTQCQLAPERCAAPAAPFALSSQLDLIESLLGINARVGVSGCF